MVSLGDNHDWCLEVDWLKNHPFFRVFRQSLGPTIENVAPSEPIRRVSVIKRPLKLYLKKTQKDPGFSPFFVDPA